MAVEIINSPEESTVKDSKKFTGVIPYTVIAINPTMAQLHTLGYTYIKAEPKYQLSFDNGGVERKSTLIDVWLKSVPNPKVPDLDVVTKLSFFVSQDVFSSEKTGKTQYVNKYGRTAWAENIADLNANEYYINEDSRPAHQGEELLYKFLFAWLNMTYDAERKVYNPCRIDVNKLFTGDYSELQDIVTAAGSYVVKVLTGVRKVEDDGAVKYYTATYNKYFLKHNQKSTDVIEKFINKSEYNEFDVYHYTYKIEEFEASAVPDVESNPAISVGKSNPF